MKTHDLALGWALLGLCLCLCAPGDCLQVEAPNATYVTPASLSRQARRRNVDDSCPTSEGTCMSRFNCMRQSGTVTGYCGTYGVCCETNVQCGRISKLKRTVITNPVTLPTNGDCSYTIEAYSTNVCQLLIEFVSFDLQPPVTDPITFTSSCEDRLEVNDFRICGRATGQHLYVPFLNFGHVTLKFALQNRMTDSTWRLLVTQLECPVVKTRSNSLNPFSSQNNLQDIRTFFAMNHKNVDQLAPAGCDQYFTESTGTITSFNYDGVSRTYLPSLNYAICIRSDGNNVIEYAVRTFQFSQQITGNAGYDDDCHSTVTTPGRREDYLMIPRSVLPGNLGLQPTYYCGTSLRQGQTVYAPQPFVMYFNSDEIPDDSEIGFSFNYRMRSTLRNF